MKPGRKVIAEREKYELIESADFCGFQEETDDEPHFVAVRVKDGALAVLSLIKGSGWMVCGV